MPSNNHILVIVVPLFSCLQSFPALGSLPMSWLFTSGSKVLELQASFQSTGASSISPSNEYSGSISLRIDWCDLFAVQETLKSLLQHHNSKTSEHQCCNFFFFLLLALTFIHDYWKNHSFDYTDLCRQSNVPTF